MKKSKKIAIFIIIIFIILFILFCFCNKKQNIDSFQDDILFFKWLKLGENKEETIQTSKINPKIIFQVSYRNVNCKQMKFSDTINKNTLINEKIAPGTSGGFEILLETNQKINYQIKFRSKNEKPQNLNFQIEGEDRKYNSLEEMEQTLKGEIEENKIININWKWEYEIGKNENKQDTEDGKKLKQYQFEIYAIGNK